MRQTQFEFFPIKGHTLPMTWEQMKAPLHLDRAIIANRARACGEKVKAWPPIPHQTVNGGLASPRVGSTSRSAGWCSGAYLRSDWLRGARLVVPVYCLMAVLSGLVGAEVRGRQAHGGIAP